MNPPVVLCFLSRQTNDDVNDDNNIDYDDDNNIDDE